MKLKLGSFFIYSFLFITFNLFAQNQLGSLIYRQKIRQENDTTLFSVTQKELLFSSSESISYTKEQTKFSGNYSTFNLTKPSEPQSKKGTVYMNFQERKIKSMEFAVTEFIFVIDMIQAINWVIKEEFKMLGKIKCQKAEVYMRGRRWTAWFTPEIPISSGPWKLNGLPGLILEAEDSSKNFKFIFESLQIPAPENSIIESLKPNPNQRITNREGFINQLIENKNNYEKMESSDPQYLNKGRYELKIKIGGIEVYPELK